MAAASKLALIILDGWGINKDYPGNAISQAQAPFWRHLWADEPHILLDASGEAVGLPEGQMGSSEINHTAIGAGRVIYQDLVRISKAAAAGEFSRNPAFQAAFANAKEHNTSLHLMGLLSPGGVHSHQDHLFALLRAASGAGVKKIFVHAFTDGRDVLPQSCRDSFAQLVQVCQETGAELATIAGRYYAMDRDHNWERTDLSYQAIKNRRGQLYTDAAAAIAASYAAGKNDEFILPCLIKVSDEEAAKVQERDSLIFFNFRNDRPRQLTERFLEQGPKDIVFVSMTLYKQDYQKVLVAFPPQPVEPTLGQVLSDQGLHQLRVTETEKFAHLTFFLNCKREAPYPLEDRLMFDSYKVASHDLQPQMRAPEIAEKIAAEMHKGFYQVIFANICNGDMVGHSGNISATIAAVEAVSQALEKIVKAAKANHYTVLITADHGNCDEMLDERGRLLTQHSLNPVPFIVVSEQPVKFTKERGVVPDISPTMLHLLNIPKPAAMTAESLLE